MYSNSSFIIKDSIREKDADFFSLINDNRNLF